jgi:hypothetical protein
MRANPEQVADEAVCLMIGGIFGKQRRPEVRKAGVVRARVAVEGGWHPAEIPDIVCP